LSADDQRLLVQKYGGSSLATAERIRAAARRVARTASSGRPVIVVVSAMGDTTDDLIQLAYQVTARPDNRELDLLLSTGETVSATLMAMALHDLHQPAVSLTGAQAGIRSTRVFSSARITDIHPDRIATELRHGKVVIVTGFQGVTEDQDITTLGRGGSDTTAVALACALHAERCEIYTDVEGIFTADPRVVPAARKVAEIGYEEMLELAQLGARVMHPRAVELGELYDMPILVASSFSDRPGVAAAIFEPLAEANISVDTIAQSSGADGTTDLSFTISRGSLERAVQITDSVAPRIGAASIDTADDLAKVSIVGTGMQSAPGYAARMFGALASAGVNINIISTSDIRITCVIPRARAEDAVRILHAAFELDRED
jgi:aspartate kinase